MGLEMFVVVCYYDMLLIIIFIIFYSCISICCFMDAFITVNVIFDHYTVVILITFTVLI